MPTKATDVDRSSGLNSTLQRQFDAVRRQTRALAAPLPAEDQVVQSMPDVSPTKWHLAHTTWFFETFVLEPFADDYSLFDDGFSHLFNSYYRGAGSFFERSRRGVIGRPTVATIHEYRDHVERALHRLFERGDRRQQWARIVEIGLHHEQQHQELLLTDIKHVLSCNPLEPAYRRGCAPVDDSSDDAKASSPKWLDICGDTYEIGFHGDDFAFDNERPRHRVVVDDFRIATDPVTCGEFMAFIDDGGYNDPRWWLAEGWDTAHRQGWKAPMYWHRDADQWSLMTLGGMRRIDPDEPVCHVSYFEADAFARWADARLPTEAEWEIASHHATMDGNFADAERFHPAAIHRSSDDSDLHRFFGDVWEWTSSAYGPYPGFEPWDDTLGEYNGKFMCNQYVLRGGSCATPRSHIRRTYRNYFPTDARWQFSGFRLAR